MYHDNSRSRKYRKDYFNFNELKTKLSNTCITQFIFLYMLLLAKRSKNVVGLKLISTKILVFLKTFLGSDPFVLVASSFATVLLCCINTVTMFPKD